MVVRAPGDDDRGSPQPPEDRVTELAPVVDLAARRADKQAALDALVAAPVKFVSLELLALLDDPYLGGSPLDEAPVRRLAVAK